jgi:2-C-methyl-D-erythritol 2,4-cyclodiphosphate synthase
MRENIATMLDISSDSVSVKATTTEGLGFTGARKGIASYSVVMIEPN